MGKTVAEKILSAHSGSDLSAGDFAVCKIDFAFGQDGTSSIIIDTHLSSNCKFRTTISGHGQFWPRNT